MSTIWLERFVLVVSGTALVSIVMLNILNLDWTQRITLGGAIVLFSYFVAHTIEKQRNASPSPPVISAPLTSSSAEPPKSDVSRESRPAPSGPSKSHLNPPNAPPKEATTPHGLTSLSDGQRFVLKQKLAAYAGSSISLVMVGGDPQAAIVFEQLVDVFKDAGWKIQTAKIGMVVVAGANFPHFSYLTSPNIAAPIAKAVFSVFAGAGIDLPLIPDAFMGPVQKGSAPDVIIVVQ